MNFLSYHAIEVVQRFKVTRSSKEGRSSELGQRKVTCEQRDAHAILQVCNQTRNVRHVPVLLPEMNSNSVLNEELRDLIAPKCGPGCFSSLKTTFEALKVAENRMPFRLLKHLSVPFKTYS